MTGVLLFFRRPVELVELDESPVGPDDVAVEDIAVGPVEDVAFGLNRSK